MLHQAIVKVLDIWREELDQELVKQKDYENVLDPDQVKMGVSEISKACRLDINKQLKVSRVRAKTLYSCIGDIEDVLI